MKKRWKYLKNYSRKDLYRTIDEYAKYTQTLEDDYQKLQETIEELRDSIVAVGPHQVITEIYLGEYGFYTVCPFCNVILPSEFDQTTPHQPDCIRQRIINERAAEVQAHDTPPFTDSWDDVFDAATEARLRAVLGGG